MRSRLVRLLAAAALVPALAAPAMATTAAPAVPKINWKSCGGEFAKFDCATVEVPLDYGDPNGAKTKIALARLAAKDKPNRIGSLFLNPGGPGGSGVQFALQGGEYLSGNLRGRFDIVGFDPRGVGASDPLHCFDSEEHADKYFEGVLAFPYQGAQEKPFYDKYRGLGPECRDDEATITAHMNTADVARDLDLLRQAVGDKKLSYLGFSYGSYLGTTYANLFPKNFRALAIDGVLNPELWATGKQIQADRTATQLVVNEFMRLCDAAGSACAFRTPEGSAKRWEKLANAVKQKPVVVGEDTVTYDLLIDFMASEMYGPGGWGGDKGTAATLDIIADAAEGKPVSAVAPVRKRLKEADYPNGNDAFDGVACADIEYPTQLSEYALIGRYAAEGSRFGPWWWWSNAACANWPVNADRYTGPWKAKTDAPVLVVGNHFDGATDFKGAQAVAKQLPNSRLLAYAGWGHTAYGVSDCATRHMNSYLLTGALPPVNTVCPANPNPFLPAAAAAGKGLPIKPRR